MCVFLKSRIDILHCLSISYYGNNVCALSVKFVCVNCTPHTLTFLCLLGGGHDRGGGSGRGHGGWGDHGPDAGARGGLVALAGRGLAGCGHHRSGFDVGCGGL